MLVYACLRRSVYLRCTITVCRKHLWSIPCAKDKSQRLLSSAAVECHHTIGILYFTPKGIPQGHLSIHCKHHTVKLWSSLQLKCCQYKSSKMLSGICRLTLPSVSNSSICSTCCCRENILKSYIAWDSRVYNDGTMFILGLFTLVVSYHKMKCNPVRIKAKVITL